MDTIQEYKNVRVINEEPEFCAFDKTRVEADFFVLCEEKEVLFGKPVYDNKICGMSILNWVVRACLKQPKIIKINGQTDVLSVIKPYVDEQAEYSVVFYANTPLLNKTHVIDMLGFVDRKRMNVCKFSNGFVFRNEYIAENDEFFSIDEYDFSSNDFFAVNSYEDYYFAKENLTKKVVDFNKQNGVYFENEKSNLIDANCDIGYNVKISNGDNVCAGSNIGENTKLDKNVSITGSMIGENVKIGIGAIIVESIIKNNVSIGDGVIIKKAVIGNNSRIESASKIFSSSVRDGAIIKENVVLDECRIGENTIIERHTKVLGLTDKTIVGKNSEIGANALVEDCVLADDCFVENGEILKNKVEK